MAVTMLIVMQLALCLPHHHHGHNPSPCIAFQIDCHGQQEDACGQSGCTGHQDDDCGENSDHRCGDCTYSTTEVIRAERDSVSGSYGVPSVVCSGEVIESQLDCPVCTNSLSRIQLYANRGVPPLHTAYIVTAIPARAPSFEV